MILPVSLDSLIDSAKKDDYSTQEEIQGKWYIAKPHAIYSFWTRLYHAYLVLTNQAECYMYYRDKLRIENKKK